MHLMQYVGGVGIVLSVAALASALRLRRTLRLAEKKVLLLATELSALQCDQATRDHAVRAGVRERARLAQKLLELERKLAEANDRPRHLADGVTSIIPERMLEGAIRRIRHGANAASLAKDFGLSSAEAELLTTLHAQRP